MLKTSQAIVNRKSVKHRYAREIYKIMQVKTYQEPTRQAISTLLDCFSDYFFMERKADT